MSGISARHGGHHVAQKFTITLSPLRSDNFTVSPSNVLRSKSGAMLPISSPNSSESTTVSSSETFSSFFVSSELKKSYPTQPSNPTKIIIIIDFFIGLPSPYPNFINHVSSTNSNRNSVLLGTLTDMATKPKTI